MTENDNLRKIKKYIYNKHNTHCSALVSDIFEELHNLSLQIITQVERRHVGLTTFHGLFHSMQLNNMEIHPRDKKKIIITILLTQLSFLSSLQQLLTIQS